MNILLTGGAGYIGSHVALSLLDSGNDITIIDNLITGKMKNIQFFYIVYACIQGMNK